MADKEFKTIEEQLEILRSRGLTIYSSVSGNNLSTDEVCICL